MYRALLSRFFSCSSLLHTFVLRVASLPTARHPPSSAVALAAVTPRAFVLPSAVVSGAATSPSAALLLVATPAFALPSAVCYRLDCRYVCYLRYLRVLLAFSPCHLSGGVRLF